MSEPKLKLLGQLNEALAHNGPTHDFVDHIVPLLMEGRAQYWQRANGAVVTEIHTYPLLTECNWWLVAGQLDDCMALFPEIEDWARRQGCTRMVGVGRAGWKPVVEKLGFREVGRSFRKEFAP
jgi:hypothetical protein